MEQKRGAVRKQLETYIQPVFQSALRSTSKGRGPEASDSSTTAMSRQEVSRLKFLECPVLIVTLTVCLIKSTESTATISVFPFIKRSTRCYLCRFNKLDLTPRRHEDLPALLHGAGQAPRLQAATGCTKVLRGGECFFGVEL